LFAPFTAVDGNPVRYGGVAPTRLVKLVGYVGLVCAALKVSAPVAIDFKVLIAFDSFAVNLERNKPGIATAANKAMIATTIMISTRVKPFLITIHLLYVYIFVAEDKK
jgi:hypothetical protein